MITPKWFSCWKLGLSKSAVIIFGCVSAILVFLLLSNRNSTIGGHANRNTIVLERVDFDAEKSRYIDMLRDGAHEELEFELGKKELEWGGDSNFWNLLGSAAMGTRDFARANECFRKAAALDGSVQSKFNVAEALFCQRKRDEAAVIFHEIANGGNHDASIRKLSEFKLFVCRLVSSGGEYDGAIKADEPDLSRWFLLAVKLRSLEKFSDRQLILDINRNQMNTWEAPYEDTLRTAFLVE